MNKESTREGIKEETHEVQDEKQEELDEEDVDEEDWKVSMMYKPIIWDHY